MTQILRNTKFLGFPVSQRRTPSVRSFFLQMEMLKTECWLGTSKNTSTSPAAVSSLPGSELAGHDKALGRLSPGSLGGKGIDTLSTEAHLSHPKMGISPAQNPQGSPRLTGKGQMALGSPGHGHTCLSSPVPYLTPCAPAHPTICRHLCLPPSLATLFSLP